MKKKVVLEYDVCCVDKMSVINDIVDDIKYIKIPNTIKIVKVFVFCNLGEEEDLFYYIDKNIRTLSNCKSIYKTNITDILEEKIGDNKGVVFRYNDRDMIEIFDKKEELKKYFRKWCKEILKLSV